MLQKTIDLVSSLEVKNETQQIAKYELIEYTERLHKENQELKKQLEEMDSKLLFTKNKLELRQECKEYKERITKAVEIINNDRMYDDNDFEGRVFQHDLLKVLENEEIIGVKDE